MNNSKRRICDATVEDETRRVCARLALGTASDQDLEHLRRAASRLGFVKPGGMRARDLCEEILDLQRTADSGE